MTLRSLLLGLGLLSAACLASTSARADTAAEPVRATYSLAVDSDDDAVTFEALAGALSSELGREVVRASAPANTSIHMVLRAKKHLLSVRVERADGRTAQRSLSLRGGPDATRREAVLLASNMARDEAQELLDALAPSPTASAPEPAAEEAAPAPAGAAPAAPAPAPRPVPSAAEKARPPNPGATPPEPARLVTAGLFWPLATNMRQPHATSHFDVTAAFGRIGRVEGLQLTMGVALSERGGSGVQLALAANVAPGSLRGLQLALGLNWAGDLRGVQLGLANHAGSARGVQVGFLNAARDLRGVQLGLLNVGSRVRGLQVGLLNVGEEVDGAVGLVSISRRSVHPTAWVSNLHYGNFGFRFRTRWMHTLAGLTVGSLEAPPGAGGVGWFLGLGKNVHLGGRFDLDVEAVYSGMVRTESFPQCNLDLHLTILPGYRIASMLRVFAGGGARLPLSYDFGRAVVRPELVAGLEF